MNLRIALLSALFLFVAGAALAAPSTTAEPAAADTAPFVAAWDVEPAAPADGYALGGLPTAEQKPVELAVYGPCGCTPKPRCPSPMPWPMPLPLPVPLPLPGTCECQPY